jgi:uncharacterized protein (TIGR03435 family)
MRLHVVGAMSCAALAIVAAGTVRAQVTQAPAFEVASVRLSGPGTVFSQRLTDTRLDLAKFPLRQVLWLAFRIDSLPTERLSAPAWSQDLRVDIHATFPEGRRALVPEMLQRLLVDRFGLRASVRPRLTDVYELVVGKDGIQMLEIAAVNELDKKFETNTALSSTVRDLIFEELDGPVRVTMTPQGMRTTTERSTYERIYNVGRRTWQLNAVRMTMPELASLLTMNVGQLVLDRTKLTGLYQFQIELPFDASVSRIVASLPTNPAGGSPLNDPTGVSALKSVEQLGLRLESRRIPLDTIVVESLDKAPTEN